MKDFIVSLLCVFLLTSSAVVAEARQNKAAKAKQVSASIGSDFTLISRPIDQVERGKNLKFGVVNVPNKAMYISLFMGEELNAQGEIIDPIFITKKRYGQNGKYVYKHKIPSDTVPGHYYFQASQNNGSFTNAVPMEIVENGAECNFPFGMNISGIEDWREQIEFHNIMMGARSRNGLTGEWQTTSANSSAWDSEVEVPTNENGYPTVAIPYDDPQLGSTTLHVLMNRSLTGDTYEPAGTYTFCVEGTNLDVQLKMDASARFTESGCYPVNVIPSKNGIQVRIDKADTLSKVELWMPGTSENTTSVYNDMFKQPLADADLRFIRAMDLLKTNNSEVSEWSDRKSENHVLQSGDNGISYELLVKMVDELRQNNPSFKALWINVPHLATDNYIRELAYFYRDNLDREVNLKVEYSNETWNGIFDQSDHCKSIGAQWSSDPTLARAYCQANQISRIGDIFKQVYGSEFDSRVTLVAGAWSNNSWFTQQIINGLNDPAINPWGTVVKEVAIAPYIGNNIADDLCLAYNTTAPVDDVLDMLEAELDPGARFDSNVRSNYDVVSQAGMKLIAYEGGQHLVADDRDCSQSQRDDLTTLFNAVNVHPRMKDIYSRMYDDWTSIVGTSSDYAIFSYITGSDKFGSWGTFEYSNQPYADAPKYTAIIDQKDKFCGSE